ncbi:MAG: hypothetical protein V4629_07370 [Pseudomonadota bacterium]
MGELGALPLGERGNLIFGVTAFANLRPTPEIGEKLNELLVELEDSELFAELDGDDAEDLDDLTELNIKTPQLLNSTQFPILTFMPSI